MAKRSRGETLHSDGRNIVLNIINKCEEEKCRKELLIDLNNPIKRAAMYGNISERTVARIKSEQKMARTANPAEEVQLKTPGRKRPKTVPNQGSDFDQQFIRKIVQNFYLADVPKMPSTRKLLSVLKDEFGYPFSREKLRLVLREMGFRWKNCGTRQKILIEKPEIVAWRGRYLQQIRKFREEHRNIVYVDETTLDNNLNFRKCWHGEGVVVDNPAKNSLMLVHACSNKGLLDDAPLLYRTNDTTGDYHGPMDGEKFSKWILEKLIPNLLPNSVVVMDNAPYHTRQINKVPNRYSSIQTMKEWLRNNGIPFDESMRKYQLFALTNVHKPSSKKYAVDELLTSRGHTVLRLPPYMCELNIMELVWNKIESLVREAITSEQLSPQQLQTAAQNAINEITIQDIQRYFRHIVSKEEDCWQRDILVERALDELIVRINQNDSDSDSSDSNSDDLSIAEDSDLDVIR